MSSSKNPPRHPLHGFFVLAQKKTQVIFHYTDGRIPAFTHLRYAKEFREDSRIGDYDVKVTRRKNFTKYIGKEKHVVVDMLPCGRFRKGGRRYNLSEFSTADDRSFEEKKADQESLG